MEAAAALIFSLMRTLTILPGYCLEQMTSALGISMGIHVLCLEQISTSVMVRRRELLQLEVAVDVAGLSMLMETFL